MNEFAGCPFCGRGSLLWKEDQKIEENQRTLFRVGCPVCRVSMTEPGPWSHKALDDHPTDDIALQVLQIRWNVRMPPTPGVLPIDPNPELTRSNSDPQTHLN